MLLLTRTALHALEPAVARQAVHRVHDEVVRLQFEERLDRAHLVRHARAGATARSEHALQLVMVDQQQAPAGDAEAAREHATARLEALDAALALDGFREAHLVGLGRADHDQPRGVGRGRGQALRGLFHAAFEALHRTRVDDQVVARQRGQRQSAPFRAQIVELAQRALMSCRADAQGFGLFLDAQGFDVDEQGVVLEQLGGQHGVCVTYFGGVGGQAQAQLVVTIRRALVGRVEVAQGLDLVLEQLDAQRRVRSERVDVQDVPAQADLARRFGERLAHVAELDQVAQQVTGIHDVALAQRHELLLEVGHRRQGLQQCLHGGHDDARAFVGRTGHRLGQRQSCEGRFARGAALASGQSDRRQPEGRQVRANAFGFGVGRAGDEQPPTSDRRSRCEPRDGERLGRTPEASGGHELLLREQRFELLELGQGAELGRVEHVRGVGVGDGHASSSDSNASNASCAAQLSASLRVRPHAVACGSPFTIARTQKARAWARPRLSTMS